MTCSSTYAPQLRSLGFRVTPQRLIVLHVLKQAAVHLSPTQILARARRQTSRITPTTVYRTLEFLRLQGLVWQINLENGHLAYELAESPHHHIVCRNCGREFALREEDVRAAYRQLERISGYRIDHEHINLAGLCPRCRRA